MTLSFLKTYKYLCILTFGLIVLGGTVRVLNAGLACPDWPLCFGKVIPDFQIQVYLEFTHRVVAGIIGVATLYLHTLLLRSKEVSKTVKILAVLAWIVIACQIVLGGLTVLWLLHAKVVTLHLAFGTGLFINLLAIYWLLRHEFQPTKELNTVPLAVSRFSSFNAMVIYIQVLLGGLVASHYASLSCLDFPLCNGELIPTLSGPGGLQVIHRLGAYFTTVVVFVTFWLYRKNRTLVPKSTLKVSGLMALAVVAQVCLGIANILMHIPSYLAVSHLALGVLLLVCGVYLAMHSHFKRENAPVPAGKLNLGFQN